MKKQKKIKRPMDISNGTRMNWLMKNRVQRISWVWATVMGGKIGVETTFFFKENLNFGSIIIMFRHNLRKLAAKISHQALTESCLWQVLLERCCVLRQVGAGEWHAGPPAAHQQDHHARGPGQTGGPQGELREGHNSTYFYQYLPYVSDSRKFYFLNRWWVPIGSQCFVS